jgi:hypothetical protein
MLLPGRCSIIGTDYFRILTLDEQRIGFTRLHECCSNMTGARRKTSVFDSG